MYICGNIIIFGFLRDNLTIMQYNPAQVSEEATLGYVIIALHSNLTLILIYKRNIKNETQAQPYCNTQTKTNTHTHAHTEKSECTNIQGLFTVPAGPPVDIQLGTIPGTTLTKY